MGVFDVGFLAMIFLLAIIVYVARKSINDKKEGAEIRRVRQIKTKHNKELDGFKSSITKRVGDYSFLISESEKKMVIRYNGIYKAEKPVIIDINNLSSFEIMQDNAIVSQGALGNALVGGFIAGGAGAIVASNASKKVQQANTIGIKFTTKDISNPVIRVKVYDANDRLKEGKHIDKSSSEKIYNQLEDVVVVLQMIVQQSQQ